MKNKNLFWLSLAAIPMVLASCSKDDDMNNQDHGASTIKVENVLEGKPIVESGVFKMASGDVVLPGKEISFQFSAAIGQALSFTTMYGWSNDLFFAPENPGIQLYKEDGTPIEGDVSDQIKLWDNGTRINAKPGEHLQHPGTAESEPQKVMEIKGTDAQGNHYASASALMHVLLHYDGNSMFTVTIQNTSGNTTNPTPFSPGVWAISYIAGGELLSPAPLYKEGALTANGLTMQAEAGDPTELATYIGGQTGIFTPLSPVLVVVYNGIDNPLFTTGKKDPGHGLSDIAQKGDASSLAEYLKSLEGVKAVYVLAAEGSTVLLPKAGDTKGSSVSQLLDIHKGDRIAIATMYGFSNDWFFATSGQGIDATSKGDVSSAIQLYDDGTAVNQYPGAGLTQFNLGGVPEEESAPIQVVEKDNGFNILPDVKDIIKVTIE